MRLLRDLAGKAEGHDVLGEEDQRHGAARQGRRADLRQRGGSFTLETTIAGSLMETQRTPPNTVTNQQRHEASRELTSGEAEPQQAYWQRREIK